MNDIQKAKLKLDVQDLVRAEMGLVVKHQLLRGENTRLYTAIKKEIRETIEAAFKGIQSEIL